MNKSQHPSNNHVLGAPSGFTIEQCSALAVTVTNYSDGTVGLKSFWRPTSEELDQLNAGAQVTLEILSESYPPVILGVSY